MSLRKILDLRHTLALRLTLWYTLIFLFSTLLILQSFVALTTSYNRDGTDSELLQEYEEFSSLYQKGGMEALVRAIDIELTVEGADRFFFRLIGKDGKELLATDWKSWQKDLAPTTSLAGLSPATGYVIKPVRRGGYTHGAHVLYGALAEDKLCQIVIDRVRSERFLNGLQHLAGASVLMAVVLAGAAGLFLARRALSSVNQITATAKEIAGGLLDRRVTVAGGGSEITELADAFNSMVDRLNRLVSGMAEMTDNIAHDLKSPVTRMRALAEMALAESRENGPERRLAADIVEQCDMLLEMVNTMLLISEAEAGATSFSKEAVDLSALVTDACDLFGAVAEEKEIILEHTLSPGCKVFGNLGLLQRMVANLLDNAIKYSLQGGVVSVGLHCEGSRLRLSFTDQGPGIANSDHDRIFKRFFRCDQSRSLPGSGLGLSLARAIAMSHGGNITLSSQPGCGSTFTVHLPALSC